MELTWTKNMSIGNAAIDSDHKELIEMTGRIKHAIRSTDDSALERTFGQLEYWLHIHFAREEEFAQAVHFPLDQCKLAHQYSIREFQCIRDELLSRDGIWSEGAVEHFCLFLENWAAEHITRTNQQMKPALQAHPYDFQPAGYLSPNMPASNRFIPV